MNTTELSHRSRQHVEDSANRYELADISSNDYVPSEPFKALFCTTAGNLVIVGVDGVDSPVLPITLGIWPLAGIAVRDTTTAVVVALF